MHFLLTGTDMDMAFEEGGQRVGETVHDRYHDQREEGRDGEPDITAMSMEADREVMAEALES